MNSFFLSFISRFYGRDISSGWIPCIFTLLDPDFLPPFPFFAPPLPPFLGGMIVSESSLASLLECPMTNCANNLYTMSWIKHSSNIPSPPSAWHRAYLPEPEPATTCNILPLYSDIIVIKTLSLPFPFSRQ